MLDTHVLRQREHGPREPPGPGLHHPPPSQRAEVRLPERRREPGWGGLRRPQRVSLYVYSNFELEQIFSNLQLTFRKQFSENSNIFVAKSQEIQKSRIF